MSHDQNMENDLAPGESTSPEEGTVNQNNMAGDKAESTCHKEDEGVSKNISSKEFGGSNIHGCNNEDKNLKNNEISSYGYSEGGSVCAPDQNMSQNMSDNDKDQHDQSNGAGKMPPDTASKEMHQSKNRFDSMCDGKNTQDLTQGGMNDSADLTRSTITSNVTVSYEGTQGTKNETENVMQPKKAVTIAHGQSQRHNFLGKNETGLRRPKEQTARKLEEQKIEEFSKVATDKQFISEKYDISKTYPKEDPVAAAASNSPHDETSKDDETGTPASTDVNEKLNEVQTDNTQNGSTSNEHLSSTDAGNSRKTFEISDNSNISGTEIKGRKSHKEESSLKNVGTVDQNPHPIVHTSNKNEGEKEGSEINDQSQIKHSNSRESLDGSQTSESFHGQARDHVELNRYCGQVGDNSHALRDGFRGDSNGESDGAANMDGKKEFLPRQSSLCKDSTSCSNHSDIGYDNHAKVLTLDIDKMPENSGEANTNSENFQVRENDDKESTLDKKDDAEQSAYQKKSELHEESSTSNAGVGEHNEMNEQHHPPRLYRGTSVEGERKQAGDDDTLRSNDVLYTKEHCRVDDNSENFQVRENDEKESTLDKEDDAEQSAYQKDSELHEESSTSNAGVGEHNEMNEQHHPPRLYRDTSVEGERIQAGNDDTHRSNDVLFSKEPCRVDDTQLYHRYTNTKENHQDNGAKALKQENDSHIHNPLINHEVDTDGLDWNQRRNASKSNPLDWSIDDLDDALNQGYQDERAIVDTFTDRSIYDSAMESANDRFFQSDVTENEGLHPFGDQNGIVHGLSTTNEPERLRGELAARITFNEALQAENARLRIRERQNREVIMNTEYEKNSLLKQLEDAKKTIRTLNTVKDGLNRDVLVLKEGVHVLEEKLHKSEEENFIKDVTIDDLKTITAELETKTQTLNESLSGKTKDIISLEANKKQLEEKFNRQSNEVEKIKKENATYCMEISSLKEHSRALQESENQYRGELEKIKKDHGLLKEEYRNMNVRLKSQSKHVNALETELEQKDKLIHRKESARQAAVDAMQRTQSEYQELSVRLQDMQSLRLQLQQEKAANHTANEQLISLRELLSGTEAMQKNVHVWWEEYKRAMNERMSEKADYERCRTKLQSVESELLYTKNERDSLKEGIRTYEVNNSKLNEHQHNLTTNLQNQVCQIANLSEEVKNRREAMETYRRQMEKLKEGSFELEKSLLKAESQIEGLKRDLSDREKEILMLRSQFSDHSDQGDDGGEDGGTSHSPDYGNQNDTTRNEGQTGLFSGHPSSTVHHRPLAAQNSASPHGQQNPHTTTLSIFGSPVQTSTQLAANSFSPQRFPGATTQPSFFPSPRIPTFNFSGTTNFTSTPNNQA